LMGRYPCHQMTSLVLWHHPHLDKSSHSLLLSPSLSSYPIRKVWVSLESV
jgi:hypothetical protein